MVSDKLRQSDEANQDFPARVNLLKDSSIHSMEQYKHVMKIMDRQRPSHREDADGFYVKLQERSSERDPEKIFARELKNALDPRRTEAEREGSKRTLEEFAPELGRKVVPLLMAKLASEEFDERELASGLLKAIGPPAFQALGKAIDSDDKEVARRVMELLPSYGGPVAPFLLRELADIVATDGAEALQSARGQKLQVLLKELGKKAVPAYFPVLDDKDTQAPVKKVTADLLREITKNEPKYTPPEKWLYDARGRVRRAGNRFEADYVGDQLVRIKEGDWEYSLIDPKTVELKKDGKTYHTYNNVSAFKTSIQLFEIEAKAKLSIDIDGKSAPVSPLTVWLKE
jgi:hypothetical protein